MLNWPSHVRVFVCTTATDMRKQFDGLQNLVRPVFGRDIFEGHLFLFFNRRRDRLKALWWDRDGLAIFAKRLEKNRYELPRVDANQASVEIDATTLSLILNGVELASVRRRKRYERPARATAAEREQILSKNA